MAGNRTCWECGLLLVLVLLVVPSCGEVVYGCTGNYTLVDSLPYYATSQPLTTVTATPCRYYDYTIGSYYRIEVEVEGVMTVSISDPTFTCRGEVATAACQCFGSVDVRGAIFDWNVNKGDVVTLVVARYDTIEDGSFDLTITVSPAPLSFHYCSEAALYELPVTLYGILYESNPSSDDICMTQEERSGDYFRVRAPFSGLLGVSFDCDFDCLLEYLDPNCGACHSYTATQSTTKYWPMYTAGFEYIFFMTSADAMFYGNYELDLFPIPQNETGCYTAENITVPTVLQGTLQEDTVGDLLCTPCTGYRYANYFRFTSSGKFLGLFLTADFMIRAMLGTDDCLCISSWSVTWPYAYLPEPGEVVNVVIAQYSTDAWGQYNLSIVEEIDIDNDLCVSPSDSPLPFYYEGLIGNLTLPSSVSCFGGESLRSHYFTFIGDGTYTSITVTSSVQVEVGLNSPRCDCITSWNPDVQPDYSYTFTSIKDFPYVIGVTPTFGELGAYKLQMTSALSYFPNDHCQTALLEAVPFIVTSRLMPDIPRYNSRCTSNIRSGQFYKFVVGNASETYFDFSVISDFPCYIEIYTGCVCERYERCSEIPIEIPFKGNTRVTIGITQVDVQDYGTYTLQVIEKVSVPANTKCDEALPITLPYDVTNYLTNENPLVTIYLPTPCHPETGRFANFYEFVGDGSTILINGTGNFPCLIEISDENCSSCIDTWPCGHQKEFETRSNYVYRLVVAQNCSISDDRWFYHLSITFEGGFETWKKWVIGLCIGVPGALLLIAAFFGILFLISYKKATLPAQDTVALTEITEAETPAEAYTTTEDH
ncbi:hypothetical protein Pelo_13090 [Pelomyxa schiedti]|nr:hypothetical protein Pelo_13090 [Pelomyxa schiedti]